MDFLLEKQGRQKLNVIIFITISLSNFCTRQRYRTIWSRRFNIANRELLILCCGGWLIQFVFVFCFCCRKKSQSQCPFRAVWFVQPRWCGWSARWISTRTNPLWPIVLVCGPWDTNRRSCGFLWAAWPNPTHCRVHHRRSETSCRKRSGAMPLTANRFFASPNWSFAQTTVQHPADEFLRSTFGFSYQSGMIMMTRMMPIMDDPLPPFVADHPFLYAIRDNFNKVLLFAGRLADPTSKWGSHSFGMGCGWFAIARSSSPTAELPCSIFSLGFHGYWSCLSFLNALTNLAYYTD